MTVQLLQNISFVFQECAFQPQGCSGLFYCENRGVLAFENVALNNEETVSVMRGRQPPDPIFLPKQNSRGVMLVDMTSASDGD